LRKWGGSDSLGSPKRMTLVDATIIAGAVRPPYEGRGASQRQSDLAISILNKAGGTHPAGGEGTQLCACGSLLTTSFAGCEERVSQ